MKEYFVNKGDERSVALIWDEKSFLFDGEMEQWFPCKGGLSAGEDGGWKKVPPMEAERIMALQRQAQRMKWHEAVAFAARAHEGQRRKGSDVPYIVHPFEVAQILAETDAPPFAVIGGLLHDVLEDTAVSRQEIKERFGSRVLAIVEALTEDKSLTWEERKQRMVDYLRERASVEELMVACADKVANLRSIRADAAVLGEQIWARFNRDKEAQRWYYGEMFSLMGSLADYGMYTEFKLLYDDVFGG